MWQGKTCTSGKTNFMYNLVTQKDDARQSSPCVRSLPLRNTEESSKRMLPSATSLCSALSRKVKQSPTFFLRGDGKGRVDKQCRWRIAAVPGLVFPFQRDISVRQEVLGGAFLCYVDT